MDLITLATTALSISLVFLAFSALITRFLPWKKGRGIGWQFIRHSVVIITLPIVGLLMMTDKINQDVGATILTSIVAYSFGKGIRESEPVKK